MEPKALQDRVAPRERYEQNFKNEKRAATKQNSGIERAAEHVGGVTADSGLKVAEVERILGKIRESRISR